MKKILSIALALVMVLSMGAAFASSCITGPFDWTTAKTNYCGQAKIEVVPYVKVSDGSGGFKWVVNDCAAAMNGENVYFALKLTVDAHADKEWFEKIITNDAENNAKEILVTTKGLDTSASWQVPLADKMWDDRDSEAVFYYNFDSAGGGTYGYWDKIGSSVGEISMEDVEATDVALPTGGRTIATGSHYINGWQVTKASQAKVSASIYSKGKDFTDGVIGEYYVAYSADNNSLVVYDEKDGDQLVTYNTTDGTVTGITRDQEKCNENTYNAIKAYFNLDIGSKVTQKLLNSNFGWEDKIEDSFKWNQTATAIVDVNCEISIPKTGDASVIAYAVMALVTAAGALKIKK